MFLAPLVGRTGPCSLLAGYAVECAIKACVAEKTERYDFPNKDLANQLYTHDFGITSRAGRFGEYLGPAIREDPGPEVKWRIERIGPNGVVTKHIRGRNPRTCSMPLDVLMEFSNA